MVQVIAAHVEETGTANTTVSFSLTAATANNRRLNMVAATGDTLDYSAKDGNGNWENARGTYSAANTITRPAVVECGSNGTSPVTFSGPVTITLTQNEASLLPFPKTLKMVSGARTISASDAKCRLFSTDTTAINYLLPDIAPGTVIEVVQGAAGVITFVAGASGNLVGMGPAAGKISTAGAFAEVKAVQMPSITKIVGASGQYLYNWNPAAQFVNAKAAAQAAVSGTGRLRVAVPGDSTTYGQGSTAPVKRNSAPKFLASNLATYSTALTGIDSIFTGLSAAGDDNRVTISGSTNLTSGSSAGGALFAMTNTTDVLTLNFGIPFDTIRVVSYENGTNAQYGVSINGRTSTLSPTATIGNSYNLVPHIWTVARGTYSVDLVMLTNGGGYGAAFGSVEVWDSTAPGIVQVFNGGSPGTQSSVMATAATGQTYFSSILAQAPNLAIIDFGINDINNNGTSTAYHDNLTAGITALQARNIDSVLVWPEDVTTNYSSLYPSFFSAIQAVSTEKNVPLLDMRGYFGTKAQQTSNGWTYDGLHNNATFYNLVGQLYAQIVAVGVGYGTNDAQAKITSIQGSAGTPQQVPVWKLSQELA